MLFVMRGRKLLAGAIGAIQATVFILAVSTVLRGELNTWTVAGYALGFGTGVIVGMMVEERLAIGYAMFRIYSPTRGLAVAEALRAAGHAATEFTAQGKDGTVTVVNAVVERKHIPSVRALVERTDPAAFITLDEAHPLQRGYFRH
ncbi:MAG: DUF5698 domain-containing protein [Anaerolineae bacterium]|nr:DUF5698 domain-containing protein [Anaerolineales bacterium]MDW8352868.1 DUF5698 domain-containing protein [Anaerolineae bacterium]